jgi:hypothetical protein
LTGILFGSLVHLERANLLGTSEDNLYVHVTDYTPTAGLYNELKALERHSLPPPAD